MKKSINIMITVIIILLIVLGTLIYFTIVAINEIPYLQLKVKAQTHKMVQMEMPQVEICHK